MKKIIRKTSAEIRREWTPEKIAALKSADFAFDDGGVTDEDMHAGRVRRVGRGFAAFRENINLAGRPKSADPKILVPIRIPASYVEGMRATGRGWQTRMSNYLTQGIDSGAFGKVKINSVA